MKGGTKKNTANNQFSLQGQTVFFRVGFNVPIGKNGQVSHDTRIRQTVPTFRFAMEQGAKIILASHLGRPKGKVDSSLSLEPVRNCLSGLLNHDVNFASDCVGTEVEGQVKKLSSGEVLLLENLRFHQEEEANDVEFAQA
ncbi:MAG: phosphoglycerate kinase [Nitrospirales bacterium]|nr:phosphoglycerate kinase [Nitrospirales bacterium]MBA3965069.1 phosphoglycerate kinase [Nitrospirales bacterium]